MNGMRARAGSETAIHAAIQRAAHQVLDDAPRILDDPVAVGLVPGSTEDAIRNAAADLQTPAMKLARSVYVFRSRFTEDSLRGAVEEGIRQYIVLGAGFDTFAYRQPSWAESVRIIEVDHPAMQDFKKHQLAADRIRLPSNVRFCPVDFESGSLEVALTAAGFDQKKPAFFSWLGVTQYLTLNAIRAILRFVGGLAQRTQISIAVVLPDPALPEQERKFASLAAEGSAAVGEPWLSRFDPADMAAHLAELGYKDCFHLAPREAQDRYFAGRRDGLRAPVIEQMLVATV
jgi:methyltransferase (TIGR00027 family)